MLPGGCQTRSTLVLALLLLAAPCGCTHVDAAGNGSATAPPPSSASSPSATTGIPVDFMARGRELTTPDSLDFKVVFGPQGLSLLYTIRPHAMSIALGE